jgi:nucleoside-diphosphate-sugar epimerase
MEITFGIGVLTMNRTDLLLRLINSIDFDLNILIIGFQAPTDDIVSNVTAEVKNNKYIKSEVYKPFIYVKDLAYVVEKLIDTGDKIDYPQSMIISPNKSYSIESITELIVQKMNFKGNVIFDKAKPDGILKKPTSNALFTKYFPNYNCVPLEYGLDASIEHFTVNYPNVRK